MGIGRLIEIGPGGQAVETVVTYSIDEIRRIRTAQLKSSDWAMSMTDRWTEEELGEIIAYRKALRDLPEAYPDPDDARDNWPDEPSCIVYGVDS